MSKGTERYKYVDDTLARTSDVLTRPEFAEAIGARTTSQSLRSLNQLFVPNIASIKGQHVYLQTPFAYQGRTDAIPVMAAYPGEKLVPDAHMSRQTLYQMYRTAQLLTAHTGDSVGSEAVVERIDKLVVTRRRRARYIARRAEFAAVMTTHHTQSYGAETFFIMHRPFLLLVMGGLDKGYTQTGPSTVIHELSHIRDTLRNCVLRIRRNDDLRMSDLRSELKAHQLSWRAERALVLHDLVEAADDDDTHDPATLSESGQFEQIRAEHANPHDPYRPLGSIRDALAEACLF